ncbi:MAG: hypothetical protein OEN20_13780, partial [Gammaproteobacteria bacterium]|nr:hypothetical protein [Gammaproteobacteria bacterium]
MPLTRTRGSRMRHRFPGSGAGTVVLVYCAALAIAPGICAAAAPLCVSDEGIYCFARADLTPLWQSLRGRTTHAPAILDELVVAGGNG